MKRFAGQVLRHASGASFAASIARSRRAITRSQATALRRKLRPYVFRDKAELKFFDTEFVSALTSATGTTTSINLVGQGTDESQRVGRKILLKQITLQGIIRLPATADTSNATDVVRLMLVWDKQTNKSNATPTDVLGTSPKILHYRELTNSGRFKVLKTLWMTVNINAGAGDGTTNDFPQMFKKFDLWKKCNIPIEFSGISGAIGGITTNNIFVLVFSHNAKAFITWRARIRYTG